MCGNVLCPAAAGRLTQLTSFGAVQQTLNIMTQLLINKGTRVDNTWTNHWTPANFNLPLSPQWNTACDRVVPASCYLPS